MHHTDKYSQHSLIIWPVWLNDWTFLCKLSGCGFESRRSHLVYHIVRSIAWKKSAPKIQSSVKESASEVLKESFINRGFNEKFSDTEF